MAKRDKGAPIPEFHKTLIGYLIDFGLENELAQTPGTSSTLSKSDLRKIL